MIRISLLTVMLFLFVMFTQVYYQYLDCGPPLIMKSAATRRLYSHMRHGGTSCMMIILWVHPLMTSTRMIVASILTLYLLCGFSVSEHDYIYLREQIARKHITFRLHRTKSIELLQQIWMKLAFGLVLRDPDFLSVLAVLQRKTNKLSEESHKLLQPPLNLIIIYLRHSVLQHQL